MYVFYAYGYFVCMYICIPEDDIRWLWTAMWLLGIELRALVEQWALLATKPSL